MARFTFNCLEHGNFQVSLDKRQKTLPCPKCNQSSKNVLIVSSAYVHEKLDNGVMARSVERLHNIEEIIEERADAHSKSIRNGYFENEE